MGGVSPIGFGLGWEMPTNGFPGIRGKNVFFDPLDPDPKGGF